MQWKVQEGLHEDSMVLLCLLVLCPYFIPHNIPASELPRLLTDAFSRATGVDLSLSTLFRKLAFRSAGLTGLIVVRFSNTSLVNASRRVASVVVEVLRVCTFDFDAVCSDVPVPVGEGFAAEVGRWRFWRTDARRSAIEAARDGW